MFLRRGCILLGLLGAAYIAAQQPAAQDGLFRIMSGPYLQNVSDSAATIMWITNRNSTAAVEFGLPDGELRTAVNSHDGLIDANERVHKVVLSDLRPGTRYRYRTLSRDIADFGSYKVAFGGQVASEFREFRTFDRGKRSLSFLVYNDIHDTPETLGEMLKAAGDRPYDFVVLNGDTLSDVVSEVQITKILDAAVAAFANRIPLFWARGNHETRGRFARQFSAYIDSPNGRYFYSFDHGPAHFIVLDTGEDKTDGSPEYSGLVDFTRYRREEAAWLAADTKTEEFRRAKYRIVFAHMPFPSGARPASPGTQPSPFTGMEDDFRSFGRTLEEAGIDLMISGHTHSAGIVEPEPGRHSYPIVRGGGPKGPNRTVIHVDLDDRALETTILRPDGSIFGKGTVAAKR